MPQVAHLLVSDLFPGDAIGNFVLAVRGMLTRRGIAAPLYAERADASLDDVRPYSDFFHAVRPEDTLFYQLSNHDPALPDIMASPCRKIVYYHNITPGHFFAPYSAETAVLLERGRSELPLVRRADALLANSQFSLAEVEAYLPPDTPRFFFPPFLRGQLSGLASSDELVAPPPACASQAPHLLTLGRVVPHKRIEDAIRIFSLLRADLPGMRLVVAGSQYEPYAERLMEIVAASPDLANSVLFTGALSREEVAGLLRNAAGLLHTSAHEGFCMPVLEAMLAGIPVFAHKQEAVAETLGGTGVLFDAADAEQATRRIKDALCDVSQQRRIVSAQLHRAKRLITRADEASLPAFLRCGHFRHENIPVADGKSIGNAEEAR